VPGGRPFDPQPYPSHERPGERPRSPPRRFAACQRGKWSPRTSLTYRPSHVTIATRFWATWSSPGRASTCLSIGWQWSPTDNHGWSVCPPSWRISLYGAVWGWFPSSRCPPGWAAPGPWTIGKPGQQRTTAVSRRPGQSRA